jgi:hypothetical protein
MDPTRFDALSRLFGSGQPRRSVLAGLAGALAAALTRRTSSSEAAAQPEICRPLGRVYNPEQGLVCCWGVCRDGRCRCGRGQRPCHGRCIARRACCGTRGCPGNQVCSGRRCQCPAGTKRCRERCIPRGRCCRNRECPGNQVCREGGCRCAPGTKPCRGACIDRQACCGGCAAGQICDTGVCRARRCAEGGPCRVFITSQRFTAALGGLEGADAICQALADAAPLARGGRYRAWLSVPGSSPSTRFSYTDQTGPYQLVTGQRIATNWATLTDGGIETPINRDELGNPIGDRSPFVWTKTQTDGTFWPLLSTCGDWESTSDTTAGGDARLASAFWSQGFQDLPCSSQFGLYCFEQG